MNQPQDPNRTVDAPAVPHEPGHTAAVPSPAERPASLAAGLGPPRSSLGAMRPVVLKEAEGAPTHIVQPKSDAVPPPEQTGDRYQLQGEIARGGMGVVLRGRDVDLGRDLAVKVLLEQHAQRPEVARRFLEEAQIGGQLQHPGVVPVYDIGRFGERPFFTMKLVKGQTLAQLLAERADSTQDRPRFLGIALQVAQTLAYAHAKGVIHRDLKPANIMVGAFGEVQVMDWGLAKVLTEGGVADEERARRERERLENVTQIRTARSSASGCGTETEAGSLLGTPAYMPPEQANGEVAHLDRRADVFGLGALLCEILTGKPPYVGRSTDEVRRKACNGDLADAGMRLDGCGADPELVALTRTCLAPEASDRPRDAQAVADGLSAYLHGVQERLHQAELAEAEAKAKAIEEARRRRLTLALAGTVLLALTLGGGGWLWIKNERDARQAQLTRDVNEALNKATALREQARTAPVGSAALFAQAREQVQRALALVKNGPADDTLKTQVARLQTDLEEEGKDRQLIAALDEARLAQAEISADNSRFAHERAVPRFREAFRAYGLPAGEGEAQVVAERIRQSPAAVREALVTALDEWDALAGDPNLGIVEPHRDWLRAVLWTAEPAEGWMHQFRTAREEKDEVSRRAALEKLAAADDVGTLPVRAVTRLAGQLTKVGANATAVQLLRRAQQQYPADFWVNQDLGTALLGVTPPELNGAVRFLTAALALRPESPGAHLMMGFALKHTGQLDEAIACCKKAIELDPKFALAHNNVGAGHASKGQLDEAIACYRQAIELDPKFAMAHCNLGASLYYKGQLDKAIACLRKAVALAPKYAEAHSSLGAALTDKRQLDEAIACCCEAIKLDPKHAGAYTNLGNALAANGQWDKAIACHGKAIELDPKDAGAHCNLGYALYGKGQVDEAIAYYLKAIALDPKLALAHTNLGGALHGKGQVDEAIACFRQAIAVAPKYAKAHNYLGVALKGKGQVEEAIACFKKALELDPKYALAPRDLSDALLSMGRVDEAVACYKKLIELDPKNSLAYLTLAALQAWFGQDKELAGTCERALRVVSDTRDPTTAERVAKICSLRQADDKILEAALVLGRRAVELGERHPSLAYFQMALGMAEYRSRRYEAADAALLAASRLGNNNYHVWVTTAFYRAMNLFRLGKKDEAHKLATEAVAKMKPLPVDEKKLLDRESGHDDLILWLAYKEAKALIKFEAAARPKAESDKK
jgi:serine/threonine-protein kinase